MPATLQYDPFDPATLRDPYPVYAELREHAPVFWHNQMGAWVLSRYEDCRDVLRDHELFARDPRRTGEDVPEFRQTLQTLDPPAQRPLRSLLIKTLHAQDFEAIRARARRFMAGLFADLAGRESFNWMAEAAGPIALAITSDLFGVESPDIVSYMEISDAIAHRMDAGLEPRHIEVGDRARQRFNALADFWLASSSPTAMFPTLLERAEAGGVPQHYIRNSAGLIFNASFGTLYAMAGNVIVTLLDHPDVLPQLEDSALVPTAADELIRFDGPAQGTSRAATRMTVIRDTVIDAGDMVVTLLAAANRDPEKFERPDELILDRSPNNHLGFGWGTHGCLGVSFGQLAVEELLSALVDFGLRLESTGPIVRRRTATVRSVDALPVRFVS